MYSATVRPTALSHSSRRVPSTTPVGSIPRSISGATRRSPASKFRRARLKLQETQDRRIKWFRLIWGGRRSGTVPIAIGDSNAQLRRLIGRERDPRLFTGPNSPSQATPCEAQVYPRGDVVCAVSTYAAIPVHIEALRDKGAIAASSVVLPATLLKMGQRDDRRRSVKVSY